MQKTALPPWRQEMRVWGPYRGTAVVRGPECGSVGQSVGRAGAWQPREGPAALPAGSHQVTGRRHRRRMAAAVGFTRAPTPPCTGAPTREHPPHCRTMPCTGAPTMHQGGSSPTPSTTSSGVFLAACTASHDSPLTTAPPRQSKPDMKPAHPSESMRSS